VIATLALTVVIVAKSEASVISPPAFTACNSPGVAAPVFAEFELPDGASIFKHFPALGITPEISDPSGPLHNGPLHLQALQGPVCNVPVFGPLHQGAPAPSFGNLILVTRADGDEWVFGYGSFDTFVP
jgi:hypothetical protein